MIFFKIFWKVLYYMCFAPVWWLIKCLFIIIPTAFLTMLHKNK